MERYSFAECTDMLLIYGECGCNARQATALYRERFRNRLHPDRRMFVEIERRLRETGTIQPSFLDNRGARRIGYEENVLQRVEVNPETSTRRISREFRMSHMSVHHVLREENLHPYHHSRVQHLLEGDYQPRLNFCFWLLASSEADENFSRKILFTGEPLFTRAGIFNVHNVHTYARNNPLITRTRSLQHRWKLNVWAGLIGNHVIGPVLLPDNVKGDMYASFLREIFPKLLEDIPLNVRTTMWLEQDGAPPHKGRQVTDILDGHFQNRWTGYRGPVRWPSRSPDLTPMDFYFWGYLKSEVYVTEINSPEEVIARIHAAVANISNDTQESVWNELLRRARSCVAAGGRHFEQTL